MDYRLQPTMDATVVPDYQDILTDVQPIGGPQTSVNATLYNLHPYENYNNLTIPFTMNYPGPGTPSFMVTSNASLSYSIGSIRPYAVNNISNITECTVDVVYHKCPCELFGLDFIRRALEVSVLTITLLKKKSLQFNSEYCNASF